MTAARDRIHAKHCPDSYCDTNGIDSSGEKCQAFDYLLDRVADDRAHAEAVKLLERGEEMRRNGKRDGITTMGYIMGGALVVEALAMDPYEQRDGQLVRKSDGRPVQL